MCSACNELKKAKNINEFEILDIATDDKAVELVLKYNIDAVPVAITPRGQKCNLFLTEDNKIKLKC